LQQGCYEDIERWIFEGRIDCGFTRLPIPANLSHFPLFEENIFAVFPEGRKLPDGPFPVAQIRNEPFIFRPASLESDMRGLFQDGDYYQPKISYSAKDDYAVMAMVDHDLGMSVLPELLLKNTNYHLQTKELSPPTRRTICLAFKERQLLPPAARNFVQFVETRYQKD
jgi:DNA-binding transcriptional LysR family regulator